MKRKRHVGFSADRLLPNRDNPREVAFAKAWREGNKSLCTDSGIIETLIPDCTPRDEQVAATVVQWLGSNVGLAFLVEVAEANPEIAEWFKQSVNKTGQRR